MQAREVLITGIGVISPIGLNRAELLSSLLASKSGVSLWESPLLEKTFPVGRVDRQFHDAFPLSERPYLDRCSQMAIIAARLAMEEAGISDFGGCGQRAGLYYGTVRGGIQTELGWAKQFYVDGKQTAKPYVVMGCMLNAAAAQISIRHQIRGPVMTHSSACSSSGVAIGEAYRAIRQGHLDVAVAGGAEATLIAEFLSGWDGLHALAKPDATDVSRSCKPFSLERSGLVLSEGAVFFVLESREHAEQRRVKAYCQLAGYGIASDAHHIGSPHPSGQVAAMQSALTDAGIKPDELGYINAHATATHSGDPVEISALNDVLGESVAAVPISSTKSIHGHMLGAASAMELAVTVLAVTESFLPATAHLDKPDPACDVCHVANIPIMGRKIDKAMSFSAGFGGTNVALVISSLS